MLSLIKFRILTSLLTSHVSCLSPQTNFPALLKIEQTLSHRSEKLVPQEQFKQGLHCLPFHLQLLDALLH